MEDHLNECLKMIKVMKAVSGYQPHLSKDVKFVIAVLETRLKLIISLRHSW